MSKVNFIFVLIFLFQCEWIHCQWLDPHNMDVKVHSSNEESRHQLQINENCGLPLGNERIFLHIKRTINLLLNSVSTDEFGDVYQGIITIPKDKYIELQTYVDNFELNLNNNEALNRVDRILSEILIKPSYDQLRDVVFSWTTFIHVFLMNKTTLILGSCFFVLYIVYKLINAKLTLSYIIKYLIFLSMLVSFMFTWIELYQDAEIQKMSEMMKYKDLPLECNPEKMSAWRYFWSQLFNEGECEKYHQIHFKEVFYSISPLKVFMEMFSIIAIHPSERLGSSVGNFMKGILNNMPWPLNLILFPIILIFLLLLACVVLSFALRVTLKFNLFHLFNIEFGRQQTINHQSQSNAPSELPLNRNFVESITYKKFKKPIHNNKRNVKSKNPVTNSDPAESLSKQGKLALKTAVQKKEMSTDEIDNDQLTK